MANRILFSIPVHERPDIIRDQALNILKFCPNSVVVMHLSKGVNNDDDLALFKMAIEGLEGVILNADEGYRVDTGDGHSGIFQAHYANYLLAEKLGIDFSTICLLSSNELLIKSGLEDYTAQHHIGCQTVLSDPTSNWHLFNRDLLSRLQSVGFLDDLEISQFYFGGQAEGQFYRKDIFKKMATIFRNFFPRSRPAGFETEEVIPPTIVANLTVDGGKEMMPVPPITLCDYCHDLSITPKLIEKIRSGWGVIYAPKKNGMLVSPHIGWPSFKTIFSVKRVPREECEIRSFIRSLAP
ncbi:hypothetical protein CSR02_14485 [Acetobacter pomorum]|uniref:Uncharacterized protein n=1 Tax=Acetobacter pomorum TaxID=65959 RepID=A0A2G4R8B8_9PROT|nr:hypothetical protein [Acetobacter pomorum]PHY92833.1 hypothetical protein CSR02_14485 [Acetobacter pomorum]GBR51697.1 hypothetical protein AA11825_2048 [Acetobacter pomorum DSM 11825]